MNEKNKADELLKGVKGTLDADAQRAFDQDEKNSDLKKVLEDVDSWKMKDFNLDHGYDTLKSVLAFNSGKVTKQRWLASWQAMAASIVFVLGSFFAVQYFTNMPTSIATGLGEQVRHELPDGSIVTLNAKSAMHYSKKGWQQDRLIHLEGEAFFDVQSGEEFVVETGSAKVTVLGTKFNVSSRQREIKVACFSGRVKVQALSSEIILVKNEQITTELGTLSKEPMNNILPTWMNGYSLLDNQPLSDVVALLGLYYDVRIDLPEKYRHLNFSGKVVHDDLSLALKSIFIPLEIPYQLQDDGLIIFL